MTLAEYSSADMSEIADSAPPDTLEETIESKHNRDVAELQRDHWGMVHGLLSQIDDAVCKAMEQHNLDQEAAEEEVMKMLNHHFDKERKRMQQAIGALEKLRDHRIAELTEWRLSSHEESAPGSDTQ